jgi:hypothetical protein
MLNKPRLQQVYGMLWSGVQAGQTRRATTGGADPGAGDCVAGAAEGAMNRVKGGGETDHIPGCLSEVRSLSKSRIMTFE